MPPHLDPLPASMPAPGRRAHVRAGFTLLEVLLAMSIMVVLVSGLAGISSVALRVGKQMLDSQVEEAIRDGFERLLRENLTEIPQDCPVLLEGGDGTRGQTLILGRATGLFPIAGLPLVTQSVAIESRRDRSGDWGLWFLYYAGDLAQARQDGAVEDELLVQVPFRNGFEKLQWQVYDPAADKWFEKWEEMGRRPHYLELLYRFSGDSQDERLLVWLPRMQQNAAGGAGDGQPGSQSPGGNPGAGQTVPPIQINNGNPVEVKLR